MFLLFGIMGAVLVGSAIVGVVGDTEEGDEDAAIFDESGQSGGHSPGTPIDPAAEDAVPEPAGPGEGGTQTGTIGADLLDGGPGDDILQGYGGDDVITAGGGDDVAFGAQGDDEIGGGAGGDRLYGEAGDDLLVGGGGDDALWGGAGDDTLLGDAGDDRLTGGDGADLLDGGDGADQIEGGLGDDRLAGGAGQDNLQGGAGDDVLTGADDRSIDWLNGGAGNDVLLLGESDLATGGAGADLFMLGPEPAGDTVAEIMDFNSAEDGLALLWDDTASGTAPEITLGETGSALVEVFADGELIGLVHGGAGLSPADIQLVPMSASAAI